MTSQSSSIIRHQTPILPHASSSSHILVVSLTLFSTTLFGWGEYITGDITAIDAKAATLTVIPSEGIARVLKTRPGVEVSVNGVKGKFTNLAVSMTVKINSKEPDYATSIEAGGGGLPESLEHRIMNTKWVWYKSEGEFVTISFLPNGVGALNQWRWVNSWKVSSNGQSIEGVTHAGTKYKMTFTSDFTKGKIVEVTGRPRNTQLIPK